MTDVLFQIKVIVSNGFVSEIVKLKYMTVARNK